MAECDDLQRQSTSVTPDDDADTRGDPPTLRLTTPDDLIAAVPYLLGFCPEHSFVAIGTGGPQRSCAMRFDLPSSDLVDEAAEHLAALLTRNRFRQAALVGYGPPDQVTPIMEAVHVALADMDVEVLEA